jgi:hypothetical protein
MAWNGNEANVTWLLVVHSFFNSAVDLKNAPGSVYEGPPQGAKAGCTLTLSDDDFLGFVTGTLNPQKVQKYYYKF